MLLSLLRLKKKKNEWPKAILFTRKKAFYAFYWRSREYAEEEWAVSPLVGRQGPMNALTGRVIPRWERIVQ